MLNRIFSAIMMSLLLLGTLALVFNVQPVHASKMNLSMDNLPETEGWGLWHLGGTSWVSDGILTIDSPEGFEYYAPSDWIETVSNVKGWAIETRMRIDPSTVNIPTDEGRDIFRGSVQIWINDNTCTTIVGFDTNKIYIAYPDYQTAEFSMNTTDDFHVYRIMGKGNSFRIFVDGNLAIDYHRSWNGGGTEMLDFGDGVWEEGSYTKSYWDYFLYDTNGFPIIDILSPRNSTYHSASLPLTIAVDNSTSWIRYCLDNQANVTVDGNTTLAGLPYGQHSIVVYANDTYGNMGASEEVFFTRAIIVPDDFSTIQGAIDAASDGDTIFVRNGTYYEHLVVNKTLSLVGENSNTTVIDGSNATSPIVLIRAGNTSFTQFTILNASQGGEGILAQDSPNISICSNIVKFTTFGIMVQGCSNAIIQSNTLTDNSGHGLEIDWSTTVTAVDNYIFGNRDEGIYAYDCQNCTLTGNFVSGNHWSGVLIQSGNGNVIINNTISNNDHVGGIWLFDGTASNTVSGNTILNNSRGVYIGFWTTYYSSPQGNLIVNNTLEGNSIGINIDYSNANAVYHNQIVGNDAQSTVKPGYSNVWDNGCEGNYWSDYNGTDSNGDGIGDTPYVIDANNVDNYPLMNVYWNPCDINHDLKVNMKDIGRSARAFGTVPGDTLWNPHADITGPQYLVPDNKVDMRDIGLIARHFGEHL